MKQQQRMVIMKDLIRKVRSQGRMDGKNRWWVSELLAADCEKAWIHTGWEYTMQKWYEWLEYMTTAWRRVAQNWANEEEDARLLDRCEAKRK